MPIKRIVFIVVLVASGLFSEAQTVIPGGYVSGTWNKWGSPYHVLDDIIVHEDSSLTILMDVDILFADTAGLTVYGDINAIGKFPISFMPLDSAWEGIRIIGNGQPGNDSVRFEVCKILLAVAPDDRLDGGGLWISNRNDVRLYSCIIEDCYAQNKGGGIYLENSDIVIDMSNIMWNRTGFDPYDSRGGAIYAKNSNPILEDVYIYSNIAEVGSGFYSSASSPEFSKCIFLANTNNAGGGVLVFHDSGQVVIEDCTFIDNYATGSGGAIAFLEGITAQVENSLFKDNLAASPQYIADGGAVFITPDDNDISFENCQFISNLAEDDGGAIYSGSDIDVVNCLFYSNSNTPNPYSGGGAIAVSQANLNVLNSTFSWNWSQNGSTLFGEDASITFINSIIWKGEPQSEYKIYLSSITVPSALHVDHSDIEGGMPYIGGTGTYSVNWAEGNIDADPHFMLPGEDFSLAWNSPCINAGRSDTLITMIPDTDLNGDPRISGGEIDMGAYEYQGPIYIEEPNEKCHFSIHPNPNNGFFKIHLEPDFGLPAELEILSLSGRILFKKEINSHTESLNLTYLSNGVYLLRLSGVDYNRFKKIIIKK